MIEDFQVKVAKYVMEWGEWIEKCELLLLLDTEKDKIKIYMDKLLSLQNDDGGFPRNWIKGYSSGIIETAKVIELASKIGLKNDERIERAIKFLIKNQLENGAWMEESLEYEDNSNDVIVSAYALKAIATAGIKGEVVDKCVRYLLESQRDDGLWPKTKAGINPDLEASGRVLIALHETKNKIATKAIKNGFESLMEVFIEKSTKEWDTLSEDILPIIEAISIIQPKKNTAARKIIDSYIKGEKWEFQDRRSENTNNLLNLIRVMALTNIINKDKVKEEINKLLELKLNLKRIIEKFENEAKEILLSKFENIGIKRNDPQKKILLGLFIYSLLEQFFWAAEYEPQTEFIGVIDRVGTLDKIENYTDYEKIRKALFRSKALTGVAKKKKEDAAKSITLFARFLMQNNEINVFEEFVKKLIEFTLFEIAPTLSGATTARKLGLLLRNYTKNEIEMYK
ncbi:MAG: prenyltransferase/squalene oxidase repeat-containing protein, partial [Candidatus Methanomethylicia archaeon]